MRAGRRRIARARFVHREAPERSEANHGLLFPSCPRCPSKVVSSAQLLLWNDNRNSTAVRFSIGTKHGRSYCICFKIGARKEPFGSESPRHLRKRVPVDRFNREIGGTSQPRRAAEGVVVADDFTKSQRQGVRCRPLEGCFFRHRVSRRRIGRCCAGRSGLGERGCYAWTARAVGPSRDHRVVDRRELSR